MEEPIFHVSTREDHPVIFCSRSDFKSACNILALCLRLYPDLTLYAFELMSNHLHLLLAGPLKTVTSFFETLVKYLAYYYKAEGCEKDLSGLMPRFLPVDNQDHFRNVVAYINRNGSAASPDCTPVTYEWGTGRFFFNPEAVARYKACARPVSQLQRQQWSHRRKFDQVEGLYEMDGYISPMCFCNIAEAEKMFDSPRQYFYHLSKSIDSYKDIARETGESLTYSDYDLYAILPRLCRQMFNDSDTKMLTSAQKIDLARKLHYDYNAGNKQICRLLKMDLSSVNSLFPMSRH